MDRPSKSKITLIISAVLLGISALVCYVLAYKIAEIKLNDMFYLSLYFQIAVFSGILFFNVKGILLKSFLSLECAIFTMMILVYAHNAIYGNGQFINLMLCLTVGVITSLIIIICQYVKSHSRSD
jgi:hypothetical protein